MILRRAKRTVAWACALVSIVLLAMAPSAMAQPGGLQDTAGSRAAFPAAAPGLYHIAFRGELLSAEPSPGSPVFLLPPGGAAEQDWQIVPVGDAYTIQDVRSGLFLGLSAEPQPHQFAVVTPVPYQWNVERAFGNRVFISVPVPGGELRLDRSPLLIFPPRVDVQWPHFGQEWELDRLGW